MFDYPAKSFPITRISRITACLRDSVRKPQQEEDITEEASGLSFYDSLAPYYREYSKTRASYLAAVDRIVIKRIAPAAKSLLDVGAGDGVRAMGIVQASNLQEVVLAEPSRILSEHCRRLPVKEVWRLGAEELHECSGSFDVITCLWNVMGHVADRQRRLLALQKMGALLADGGRIFLDVNNRYNARAYGWLQTLGRVFYDKLLPSEMNGDITFGWNVGGKVIQARGHVFTPSEIEDLIREAGLKVVRRFVLDYRTGHLRRFSFEGQLLYELQR